MSKHILPDELYKEYEDEKSCFGEMFDANHPDCKKCKDKAQCELTCNADTVIKASLADPAQTYDDSDGFTKESVIEFIENSCSDEGIKTEKVELKTRDQIYCNDEQVFVVTDKKLKCLLGEGGGDFGLSKSEWEELGKGFTVDLENEAAVRTLVTGVIETLLSVKGVEIMPEVVEKKVEESDKKLPESPQKEDTSVSESVEEESSDESVMETLSQETPEESVPASITVDNSNLDAGFGVYFGNNGVVKVEIYMQRDKLDKAVLLEKIENLIDGFIDNGE